MAPTLKSVSKALRPVQGSAAELVLTIVTILFLLVVLPHQSLVPLPNDEVDVSNHAWPLNFAKEPVFRIWWPHYVSNLLFAAANSIKDASATDGTGSRLLPTKDDDQFHDKLSDADIGMRDHPLNSWISFDGYSGGKNTSTGTFGQRDFRRRAPSDGPYVDPQSGDPETAARVGNRMHAFKSTAKKAERAKSVTTQHPKVVKDPDANKAAELIASDNGACAFTMEGCPHCDTMKPVLEEVMQKFDGKKGFFMWIHFGPDMKMTQEELAKTFPHISQIQGVPDLKQVKQGSGEFTDLQLKARDVKAVTEFVKSAASAASASGDSRAKPGTAKGMHVKPRAAAAAVNKDGPAYGPETKAVHDNQLAMDGFEPMQRGGRAPSMISLSA